MDQTPAIAGLAAGLGVGVVLIIILAICVYWQYQRYKNRPQNQLSRNYAETYKAHPIQETSEVRQITSDDVNPETGQPLPMAYEVGQGMPFTSPQSTSFVSPVFLQPSLAFNSSAAASNQFANRLYPSAEGGHSYGNDALVPPPRLGRLGFRRTAEWLGPAPQQQPINAFHLQNPLSRPPVVEREYFENVVPLGSNEREAFSDGEEIERRKKKKNKKSNIQVHVVKANKLNKKRRSRHHSDVSSSSESESESESDSDSSDGNSSDSSSESVKKLRILKPGADSVYYLDDDDGYSGKKKGKKHRKRKVIAMIPPAPIPQQVHLHPVQPPPPQPPPPEPPQMTNPQPMVFILPNNNQQQVEQPPRIQEYDVRPVSVPAHNTGAAFWSADGGRKQAYFKTGGATGSGEYETQERTAQLEDEVQLRQRSINVQISGNMVRNGGFGNGGMSNVGYANAGYTSSGGGDCGSCQAGGNGGWGVTGGGVHAMGSGVQAMGARVHSMGGGCGATGGTHAMGGGFGCSGGETYGAGASHGSNYGGIERQASTQHGDGFEENGYSISF